MTLTSYRQGGANVVHPSVVIPPTPPLPLPLPRSHATAPSLDCSYCNDCRDLDLCRDDELARHRWNCRVCEQPYNQASLEQRLVLALQHRVREYQLQDLQCVRCKQVRPSSRRRGAEAIRRG